MDLNSFQVKLDKSYALWYAIFRGDKYDNDYSK